MKSNGIKVALVDDSSVIRNSIQEILSMWGYNISLTAIHGKDLLRQLSPDNMPDICITDLNMPVMDGFHTIAALKAAWPDVKIIAFSITNTKREEEQAVEAGAHAFVSKLSSIMELKKVLRSMQETAGSDY
jgi:CheY-like chemotaxis protein